MPSPASRSPRSTAPASTSRAMLTTRARVGGPALRRMTFHERALHAEGDGAVPDGAQGRVLRALAADRRDQAPIRGSTSRAASARCSPTPRKGRRELPNETFYLDGATEALSKGGTFVGRHICVPLEGVAVHINAFNFPVLGNAGEARADAARRRAGDREAGDGQTSYLTEAVFRAMVESGILPAGAIQLICGSAGDLLDHLDLPGRRRVHRLGQRRAGRSSASASIVETRVRFNMEADSLNCSMLGPDAAPGHAGVRPVRQGGGRAR